MQILILEDYRLFNTAISFNLENEGHTVHSCFNGNEALKILKEQDMDLIISDLITPQRTGLNFLINLKEGFAINIPIIIISGLKDAEKLIAEYDLNCIAFYKKPIDQQLVIDEVSRISNNKN